MELADLKGTGAFEEDADAVGLSKAGLLHHFPSKDALHEAVLAQADTLGKQVLDQGIDGASLTTVLVEERDAGRAVFLISLEMEEIRSLSDRVLVIYEGQIVAEMSPEASEEDFGVMMTGGGRGAER